MSIVSKTSVNASYFLLSSIIYNLEHRVAVGKRIAINRDELTVSK